MGRETGEESRGRRDGGLGEALGYLLSARLLYCLSGSEPPGTDWLVPEPGQVFRGDGISCLQMPSTALIYGTIVIDRLRRIDGVPQPGEYCEYREEEWFLGGEAANTAAALSKWLPGRVVLSGNSIGSSTEGAWLADRLRDHGLSLEGLDPEDCPAPTCDIYVDSNGERTMFGRGWDTVVFRWPEQVPAWVACDPNHGEAARRVVREAQSQGIPTYLLDFLRPTDPITSHSVWQSSTDWVGKSGDQGANLEFLRRLVGRTGCTAILTDGADGVGIATPRGAVWCPAFPLAKRVDATGAGDIFRAGMLRGLLLGEPLGEAAAFASAAGCLNCLAYGATGDIPTESAVRKHLAAHPAIAEAYRLAIP